MSDAILTRDLSVGHRDRTVVEAIDLVVEPGEMLALVGTNGSGKSTLLKTIVGLLPAVAGDATVLGSRPGSTPRQLAYLGQFHASGSVLPLRARDVVSMGRFAHLGLFRRFGATDRALVDEGLSRMGIADLADRPLRELSGGQQQRTFLAQVLAHRAELLVLDEPTAGIDAAGRATYESAMAAERDRGAAVVVATHDIGEASRASKVLLLAGRVVAAGTPAEVLTAENLLEAFGIAVKRLGEGFIVTEQPHAHHHPEPGGSEEFGHH